MKNLYWVYASSVTMLVTLLSIWGVFGATQGTDSPPAERAAFSESHIISSTDTDVEGKEAVYHAVASPDDIARYHAVAEFTREKRWDDADAVIAKLENSDLVGYYLAARYTDTSYTPSAMQMKLWFSKNSYLPQAQNVLRRMRALYPKEAAAITLPAIQRLLKGYGDSSRAKLSLRSQDNELWRSGFASLGSGYYSAAYQAGINIVKQSGGKSQHGNWLAGLAAWHLKDFSASARHFSAMAANEDVAPTHRAAAAFWSYRAYKALGNSSKAQHYLQVAAQSPQSFYGLAATAALNGNVWRPKQEDVTQLDGWEDFVEESPVAQIVLLNAIGDEYSAERLLRHVYFQFDASKREHLTALAHTLGMAAAVLPMARQAGADSEALQAALYPVPEWRNNLQRSTDDALILAIVKQESGFNPKAGSPKGAQGLMQILPSTAAYMRRQKGTLEIKTAGMGNSGLEALPRSWDLKDPAYNLAIGQAYLRYLSAKPYINNNIVYLLAAYNAGAAPLLRWKESIGENDPLLFIESIPFVETRHYVKNVLSNYWIYEGILDDKATPKSLERLMSGHWPMAGKV